MTDSVIIHKLIMFYPTRCYLFHYFHLCLIPRGEQSRNSLTVNKFTAKWLYTKTALFNILLHQYLIQVKV